jgi:hypothetical protein
LSLTFPVSTVSSLYSSLSIGWTPLLSTQECCLFLADFRCFLLDSAGSIGQCVENNPLLAGLLEELQRMADGLRGNSNSGANATTTATNTCAFPSLPAFSRALRVLVTGVEKEQLDGEAAWLAARSKKQHQPQPQVSASTVMASGAVDSTVAEAELDPEAATAAEPPAPFLPRGMSLGSEFLARWTVLVPRLTALAAKAAEEWRKRERKEAAAKARGSGSCIGKGDGAAVEEDEDDDEDEDIMDESVEQEGCPDENDFNR